LARLTTGNIGVHVGKEWSEDQVVENPAGVLVHFDLHLRLSDDADDAALVRDQGGTQAAGTDTPSDHLGAPFMRSPIAHEWDCVSHENWYRKGRALHWG
jgi:hypothetical protein